MRVFVIAELVRRREILSALLSSRGVDVVGSASDLQTAEDELPDEEIDVVLVDAAGEPVEEFLESLRGEEWLRESATILLTQNAETTWTTQAMRAGVRGILPANVGPELLVAALAAVGQGLVVLHPERMVGARTSQVAETEEAAELLEALTSREKEVLRMLAEGLGNKQIAARLEISEHTAKFHVASIFGKLGVSSRAEAVAIGMRRGLILL
ncbi:MAG: response regulator transcription factor [Candidatus Acidiferrum sp.]